MSSQVTTFFTRSIAGALLSSALVSSTTSFAAEETETRWFEIEVIVFKDPRATGVEELWPETLKRSLPENTQDIALEQVFPIPESFSEASVGNNTSVSPADLPNNNPPEVLGADQNQGTNQSPAPFGLLTEEQLQLSEVYQSLRKSSRYQTLSHYGWRQPVPGKNDAPWVRIIGGTDYSEQFTLSGSSVGEQDLLVEMGISTDSVSALLADRSPTLSDNHDLVLSNQNESVPPEQAIDTSEQAPQQPEYIPVPEIDGAIKVYLSRYLHINTQLYFRKPGKTEVDIGSINANLSSSLLNLSDDGVIDSDFETGFNWNFDTTNLFEPQPNETVMIDALQDYLMQQSRRIRSGELHYFDHPLFGIIVQVRPFDPEAEDTSLSSNSDDASE